MFTHQEGAEKTKDCLIYQQKITCKLRENFLPFFPMEHSFFFIQTRHANA